MNISFLGIGVQKGGTSTLHDILKQHSQIYLPESKEAHFFDLSDRYTKGLNWLKDTFFSDYSNDKIAGKFTPEYIYFDNVPERIAVTLGNNIKFIIVFRNPVERAISHYNMSFRKGIEKQDFWTAIEQEEQKIKKSELANVYYSYINRGLYASQLERYLKKFPGENFLYLTFEKDIVQNLENTSIRIQNFLGLRLEALDCNVKSNEAYSPKSVKLNRLLRNNNRALLVKKWIPIPKKWKRSLITKVMSLNKSSENNKQFNLNTNEKMMLFKKFYAADTARLEQLTGLDLNSWKYE